MSRHFLTYFCSTEISINNYCIFFVTIDNSAVSVSFAFLNILLANPLASP